MWRLIAYAVKLQLHPDQPALLLSQRNLDIACSCNAGCHCSTLVRKAIESQCPASSCDWLEMKQLACGEHSDSSAGKTRRIYVDSDAWPFKDVIVEIASANGWSVRMVANYWHQTDPAATVEVIHVNRDCEAVDVAIVNRARAGDLVLTHDYGLAALVLRKGAPALSRRGRIYDRGAIEALLAARHHARKSRRSGERLKGPPRLRHLDRERLRDALEHLVRS